MLLKYTSFYFPMNLAPGSELKIRQITAFQRNQRNLIMAINHSFIVYTDFTFYRFFIFRHKSILSNVRPAKSQYETTLYTLKNMQLTFLH